MKRNLQHTAWQQGVCLIESGDTYNVACEVRQVTGLRLTDSYSVARQYQEWAVAITDSAITNMMIEGRKI